MTLIGGNINSNATIYSATEENNNKSSCTTYSVAKAKKNDKEMTGVYDITFTTPFTSCPIILSKQNNNNWSDFSSRNCNAKNNTLLVAVNTDKCRIKTGDSKNNTENKNFSFIALSPETTQLPSNVVVGHVTAKGERYAGTNFACKKISTGYYIIALTSICSTEYPVVVAQPLIADSANTCLNATIVAIDKEWIEIKIGNDDGDAMDAEFVFVAYDPSISPTGENTGVETYSGTVNASGDAHSGSGFQVTHTSTNDGHFTINFDNATLEDKAIIFACENYFNWTDFDATEGKTTSNVDPLYRRVSITQTYQQQMDIKTGDESGKGIDRNFCFWCVNLAA